MISTRQIYKCFLCLSIVCHSIAIGASRVEGDESTGLCLSIAVQEKDCTYTVTLKNNGSRPAKYVDMLRYKPGWPELLGPGEIVVRDKDHRILSKVKHRTSEGYTWAIYQSQAYPATYAELRPGEEGSIKGSLKVLCRRLCEMTSAKRQDAKTYEYKLRVAVFLDIRSKKTIESENSMVEVSCMPCRAGLKP